ncbi:MAG: glycosyl transferase [Rhodospirillaceae bacterium]|nr:glycosyl transferase [Rhodospirillaceae bacterium]
MRILFISSNRLGDAILSTGLLQHLLEEYPEARFTVACGRVAASLFEAMPRLDRIIVMRKGAFGAHWRTILVAGITSAWFMVVDMRGSVTAWVLPTRHRRIYRKRDRTAHRVEDMRHTLHLDVPAAPHIWIGPIHESFADGCLGTEDSGPLLVLGPTANWDAKVWPTDRFAALTAKLTGPGARLEGARVVVVGGPGEEFVAAPLCRMLPEERLINLVGESVLNTAAVIARASLYVGNDSGLMHLAAATGAPTLGLFGPTRDDNYAPWGRHVAVVRTDQSYEKLKTDPDYRPEPGRSLMEGLPVDRAFREAVSLLARVKVNQ